MFIKYIGQNIVKYPYELQDFVVENPYTNPPNTDLNFIFVGTEEYQKGYRLAKVVEKPRPVIDGKTHKANLSLTPAFEDGEWVLNWVIEEKTQQELFDEINHQEAIVRQQRTFLLSQSDWRVLPDVPGQKEAWYLYRQALRDITSQESFPFNVVWPNPPTN